MEHRHHGKSSESFISSDEILQEFDFKGFETFMDAGCGDGHIAIKALKDYLPEGKVFAVDVHAPSIENLQNYKIENGINNLIAIVADISEGIGDVEDKSVDVVLMVNVFHGFKASGDMDEVISELNRLLSDDGIIAVMDFKPFEMKFGPPVEIRSSPEELEEIFNKHGLVKIYLNEEFGKQIDEVKSHYLIMFKKE